jgi:hypothetical protein
VTAHRRSRMPAARRLVAVIAVALSAVMFGSPAMAADAPITVTVAAPPDFHLGDTHNVSVTVTNQDPPHGEPGDQPLTAALTIDNANGELAVAATTGGGSACTAAGPTCNFVFADKTAVTLVFSIKAADSAADIPAGGNRVFNSHVLVTDSASNTKGADFSVKLFGPPAPPANVTISGTVFDQTTGAGIPGALVSVNDPAGKTYNGTSDAKGAFKIVAAGPVAVGQLLIGAAKENYDTKSVTHVTLQPGQATVTGVRVLLAPTAAAPSSSASASLPASPSGTASATSSADASDSAPVLGADPASDSGGGLFGSGILIAGIILVLVGAAAFAFVLLRRRNEDGGGGRPRGLRPDSDDDGPPPAPLPGLGDAPTMIQARPVVDEYPDPYAAPTTTRPIATRTSSPGFRSPVTRPAADPYQDHAPATSIYPGEGYPPRGGYASDPPAYEYPSHPQSGYGAEGYRGEQGYGGHPPDGQYPAGPGYDRGPAPRGHSEPGYRDPGHREPGHRDPGHRDPGHPGAGYDRGHAEGYPPGGYPPGGYPPSRPADAGHRAEGYPPRAYDEGRYDQSQRGVDAPGYDPRGGGHPPGRDARGHEEPGHDAPTYHAPSHNTGGYSANSHDAHGYDSHGYDSHGHDSHGYDSHGNDAHGYNAGGFNANGYNAQGYDANGYDVNGHNANGYDTGGYDTGGYDQTGYGPRGGHSQPDGRGGYPPRGRGGRDAPSPRPTRDDGYPGGYPPQREQGSVDWLDD